jgi:hypothetical protein
MKDFISANKNGTKKTEPELSTKSDEPPVDISYKLGQFLHDFQQPLTVIMATSQLMQLRDLDEVTSGDVDIIFNAANQLENLAIQMREYINKHVA